MEIGLNLGEITNIEAVFERALYGKGLVFIKFKLLQGFGIPGLDDLYHQLFIPYDPGMDAHVRRFDLFQ